MTFQLPGHNHPLDDYERGPRAAAPSPGYLLCASDNIYMTSLTSYTAVYRIWLSLS